MGQADPGEGTGGGAVAEERRRRRSLLKAPHAPVLPSPVSMKKLGENVVRIEAHALQALADRLAGPMSGKFERAVELMLHCGGRTSRTPAPPAGRPAPAAR